jgi:hypothetical protein
MAKLSIVPRKPFDLDKLDPAVQAALKHLPRSALQEIARQRLRHVRARSRRLTPSVNST